MGSIIKDLSYVLKRKSKELLVPEEKNQKNLKVKKVYIWTGGLNSKLQLLPSLVLGRYLCPASRCHILLTDLSHITLYYSCSHGR